MILGRILLRPVLRIADLLQPVDRATVQLFLNRDVAHRCGGTRTMPMLLARRKPDDIARAYFLDGTTVALHSAKARCNNQRLAERMRVPGGACTRLEGNERDAHARGVTRIMQWIDPHGTGKPIRRAFAGRL